MRSNNSAFGSISLTLGFVWLVYFLISLIFGFLDWLIYLSGLENAFTIPILALIYSIIGIMKDKKRILSGIGLGLGISAFALTLAILILFF